METLNPVQPFRVAPRLKAPLPPSVVRGFSLVPMSTTLKGRTTKILKDNQAKYKAGDKLPRYGYVL